MAGAVVKTHQVNNRKRFRRLTNKADAAVQLACAWIAAHGRQDDLVKAWQDAEHELSLKARTLGVSLDAAARSNLAEAKSMRSLMRSIKSTDRELMRGAAQIAQTQSMSSGGVLAKLDVALRMKQPSGDDEQCWALVRSAMIQLRELSDAIENCRPY